MDTALKQQPRPYINFNVKSVCGCNSDLKVARAQLADGTPYVQVDSAIDSLDYKEYEDFALAIMELESCHERLKKMIANNFLGKRSMDGLLDTIPCLPCWQRTDYIITLAKMADLGISV